MASGRNCPALGESLKRMASDLRKRILILSASVGGGHIRAAEAMELAFRQTAPWAEIRNIDVLTLANKAFRRIYGKGYLDLANRAPHFLGYVYDFLDRPKDKDEEGDFGRLRVALEKLNMQPFLKLLKAERWDIVVNTHFLPAEIIGSLRSSGSISVPQVTVTTDFMTHRMWIQEPCEHYFAACNESAAYLNSWGVPWERISVTGIPIHPVFCRRKGRAACLKAQGIRGDRPIVLLLSGGFGVGPIEQIFHAALTIETPMDVVVVCGRNAELGQRLAQQQPPRRQRVKILGYTTEIDELMAVADVVISKPGGLSSAEVLARGSVLAIVNPIPGQESRNSDYLLENWAAVKIGPLATLPYKINALLNDPHRLERLKANARRLGRPRAAFAAAEKVLTLIRAEKPDDPKRYRT
jgi:processive 1,2-diacylglycerol beta-glucosyltransferase